MEVLARHATCQASARGYPALPAAKDMDAMEEPEIRIKPNTGLGRDLTIMSVEELERFIRELEGEIVRVRAELKRKADVRGAAEALFRRPPGAEPG